MRKSIPQHDVKPVRSERGFRPKRFWWTILPLLGLALFVYIQTLAPGHLGGDAGEFQFLSLERDFVPFSTGIGLWTS